MPGKRCVGLAVRHSHRKRSGREPGRPPEGPRAFLSDPGQVRAVSDAPPWSHGGPGMSSHREHCLRTGRTGVRGCGDLSRACCQLATSFYERVTESVCPVWTLTSL